MLVSKFIKKKGSMYSSHLRLFAYTVDQDCVQITDYIIKLLKTDEYIFPCTIYESLINENIHYEGHVMRYLKS